MFFMAVFAAFCVVRFRANHAFRNCHWFHRTACRSQCGVEKYDVWYFGQ